MTRSLLVGFVWAALLLSVVVMYYMQKQFEYRNNLIQTVIDKGRCNDKEEKAKDYKLAYSPNRNAKRVEKENGKKEDRDQILVHQENGQKEQTKKTN